MSFLKKIANLFGSKPQWRKAGDAKGLDWAAMKVNSQGCEYFDLGDVHLYPWAWDPIMDVCDAKTGHLIEENIRDNHPKYGRELYRRYLLPDRHNNVFPDAQNSGQSTNER